MISMYFFRYLFPSQDAGYVPIVTTRMALLRGEFGGFPMEPSLPDILLMEEILHQLRLVVEIP